MTLMTTRRRTLALTLAATSTAAMLAFAPQAGAQSNWPDKPVRLIVGFPAGTGPDIVARTLAQKLTEEWKGGTVVVDNKPGAGGLIAASEAARAAPDGYTFMLGEVGQLAIAPSSYNRLPYDPAKDFIPVSQVVSADMVLVINPEKVAARNVKDYVAWTKQQKGLFMGTFGAGTPGHFGAFMFGEAIGIKPEPVHYRTTSDALGGLFSGDVSSAFATVGLAAPNIKAGKLYALGSTGTTRSPTLPDVPTIQEQGYPGLAFAAWFGVVAPAKTPDAIVAKLSADIQRIVQSPEGSKKLLELGFRPTGTSAAEFKKIMADDTVTWGKAVAATGFKAD